MATYLVLNIVFQTGPFFILHIMLDQVKFQFTNDMIVFSTLSTYCGKLNSIVFLVWLERSVLQLNHSFSVIYAVFGHVLFYFVHLMFVRMDYSFAILLYSQLLYLFDLYFDFHSLCYSLTMEKLFIAAASVNMFITAFNGGCIFINRMIEIHVKAKTIGVLLFIISVQIIISLLYLT